MSVLLKTKDPASIHRTERQSIMFKQICSGDGRKQPVSAGIRDEFQYMTLPGWAYWSHKPCQMKMEELFQKSESQGLRI